ncbi:FMN-dependent NADH-azoreductase [Phytophthora citrophthora]|uniref:FMN-dependent NADH-azoreductase n=1 Tax=Phytophthora citrophthora TaxID=4793 RepID=A0AAD9GJ16_9STRA|nr:FMN-dependent NADH-azoreductase [Phytophthora citrophthora]
MQKQTILHINASLTHKSVTDRVAAKMIDHLTHHYHRHICGNNDPVIEVENPENVLNIEECDVWSSNMPKFDRETMSRVWKARHGSEDVADLEAFRPIKELAEQMLRADFLVITSPVWNFSVPYALKQYIDCVVQAGLTFHDKDDEGPSRPYFRGKPLIVISSSGGKAPPAHEDYVFPFLSRIFAMCGFDDAHRVAIEDLATHDKEECFRNAVREANCIADNVVQNHKLRLDMDDE